MNLKKELNYLTLRVKFIAKILFSNFKLLLFLNSS